ncbi:MAG TPA: TIGR03746 family integrating conjugative element protein [Steroidobacteraceae bacterium]|nr:TIGR03746 family integrating conjugative element protein [Steroidobacteraceae bacterium]
MSRFRNEVARLEAHVKSLKLCAAALFGATLLCGLGWWHAPRDLTIHIPPDLRSGSVRKWWDIPPEDVYAFALYVFQALNRWPSNGETDYPRNIYTLSPYLTPECQRYLKQDSTWRAEHNELRDRMRGVFEIAGRGYGDDSTRRVRVLSRNDWIVTLDLDVDEYYRGDLVKRAFVRYPIRVVRYDVDPQHNPWGLALDCFAGSPERIPTPAPSASMKHGIAP